MVPAMRTQLAQILAASPILTLFVVIGLGWLLGQLEWRGFRLGVAGVLFVGLAIGALGPAVLVPEIVSALGLVIFVYTIGIQSGPAFFSSFRTRGYRETLLAVVVLIFGAALTAGLARPLHLTPERTAGLYTGALTNTPALAASRERVRDYARERGLSHDAAELLAAEPVVAYSIAYPFGVIGVILCLHLVRRLWRVEVHPTDDAPEIRVRNFVVENPAIFGRNLETVLLPHRNPGFVVSRVRQHGKTVLARSNTELSQGDIVAVVGDDDSFERVQQIFGAPSEEHIELDRSHFDYRRVFVSSKEVVGRRIGDLDLADGLSATITRLRRGDADLVPTPQTRLEYGDRVRVLTLRENFGAVSRFFGDSIRGTAETDFGSVAIGMVLGVLLGMAPLPLPGGACWLPSCWDAWNIPPASTGPSPSAPT
jgi:putative transport protein